MNSIFGRNKTRPRGDTNGTDSAGGLGAAYGTAEVIGSSSGARMQIGNPTGVQHNGGANLSSPAA